MSNRVQTDKIYLNAMLEVTKWTSNLDQYYRDVVVTKNGIERALDNR